MTSWLWLQKTHWLVARWLKIPYYVEREVVLGVLRLGLVRVLDLSVYKPHPSALVIHVGFIQIRLFGKFRNPLPQSCSRT